ncbi:hypothetical protein MMC09_002771 [Bachmanniomyces sp. S44760]|nr:hypothetical protein [Bachmanniomyces sp. S44760]
MEDGSHTDNRLGAVELTVPRHTTGPPAHWHEMHDESFLVTHGTIRFHSPGKPDVDAKAGDYVVVPTRAPHTFSNPFGEEGRFFNTFTPAFYVQYFKLLSLFSSEEGGKEGKEEGGGLSREVSARAMARYATIIVDSE